MKQLTATCATTEHDNVLCWNIEVAVDVTFQVKSVKMLPTANARLTTFDTLFLVAGVVVLSVWGIKRLLGTRR